PEFKFVCSQTNRPPKHSALGEIRQCIYDPRTDGLEYWLSGPEVDCHLLIVDLLLPYLGLIMKG
uniref:Uncharacterized protein n=1 Tax=Meloidogyne incognita TaxID=6306 RepID=A0A914P2V8_MELIC